MKADFYIPTPQIASELIGAGYAKSGQAPGYRAIYQAILDGRIAAEQINGRYRIQRSQLPKIAEIFGLSVPSSKQVT